MLEFRHPGDWTTKKKRASCHSLGETEPLHCDQVATLATYIEQGIQYQLKSATVSRPDGRIWYGVAHWPLSETEQKMPYWLVHLTKLLLWGRRFRVHLGEDVSSWRTQSNGLPQGFIFFPHFLQPVHQRPVNHWMPQIHLRKQHLPGDSGSNIR